MKTSTYTKFLLTALVTIIIFISCSGDENGDKTTSLNIPLELNTSKTTVPIGSEGGEITVPYDDELIAGTMLTIPSGAVNSEVTFTLQGEPEGTGPTTLQEAAESANTFHSALVNFAVDNVENTYFHPMYGPVLLISSESFIGHGIRFSPANQTFNTPLTASIPLDLLSIDTNEKVMAMLQSEDGTWEALSADINNSTSMINTQIHHFSSLRFLNYFSIIGPALFHLDSYQILSGIETANEFLPHDTFEQTLQAAICTSVPLQTDLDNVIDEYALLDELMIGSGPAANSTTTGLLYTWLQDKYNDSNVSDGSITFAQLYAKALEIENGNIYKALATTNAVLSVHRHSPYTERVVEKFRGDGGDETGARYHFFGAALHAFVHEYHREHDGLSNIIYDPEAMVTVEEHIVSGDIFSDTTEYAVDLKGVVFGRELYHKMQGKSKEELIEAFDLEANACYEYSYSYNVPSAEVSNPHLSVSINGMYVQDEGDFIYWRPNQPTGTITYHFNFQNNIASAKLLSRITTFNWSYGEGYGFLYASTNGIDWQDLLAVTPPALGEYNMGIYNEVLPETLTGSKDLWIQVVLYSLNREGERVSANTSQFSRAWPERYPDSKMFELNVGFE